jgi:hypothetical protein
LTADVGSPATTGQPPSSVIPGHIRLADVLRTWWWLALLLAVVSLIVGGSVQHAFDQRHADRSLYDVQVLTTASRFFGEEARQIALPVAQRNGVAFEDLADSINSDIGVNGEGTLHVSLGSGSAATFTQIAFEINVASPYASTTFVVWFVRGAGPGGMGQQNVGTCLLSTSLQGAGRATANLDLGASGLFPCTPDLWSAHQADPMAPRLALAHIPQSGNF